MIRHLLALTWNRRRTNLLLLVELFVTFLVLLALITTLLWGWDAYRQPLGYSIDNVWRVGVSRKDNSGHTPPQLHSVRNQQLMQAIAALPQVAAGAWMTGSWPYSGGGATIRLRGRSIRTDSATDSLAVLLGLEVVRGRWFAKEDAGATERPVVLTQAAARELFGTADPLGARIEPTERGEAPMRVVGVIRAYRPRGEFGIREDMLFERLVLDGPRAKHLTYLLVKLRPGTPVDFDETLKATMKSIAKDWSFSITPLEERRQRVFEQVLGTMAGVLVLAGFLILMVVLGLSGVVWQNVTQRRSEIGLRRALGATAGDVQRQFLGELLAMATLAMIAGGLVFLNFAAVIGRLPVFGDFVTWQVYLAGFAISVVSLYGLVIVAGTLPTRLAARVQPLEALRHE